MQKTFYIQLDKNNIVRDVIEFPHEGYLEVILDTPLPVGISGGWFKYENGELIECPELKPKPTDEQRLEELEQIIADLAELILGVRS